MNNCSVAAETQRCAQARALSRVISRCVQTLLFLLFIIFPLSVQTSLVARAGQPVAIAPERLQAERAFDEAEQLKARQLTDASREAIEKYQEARDYWLAVHDLRAAAQALRKIGQVHQSLDEFKEATDAYTQALALGRRLRDARVESDVLNDLGHLQADVGENQKALENSTRALKLSRALGHRAGEAQALYTLGDVYYNFGDLQKALKVYRQSLQLWESLNDYEGQAKVLVSFGYTYIETSDIEAARDAYNRALALSRQAGDRHAEAATLRALGNLQTKLGENQQAFNLFLQALEILKTLDDSHLKATVLGGLAYSYESVGEKRRALEYYEQALTIFKQINHTWGEAEALMPIGEIYYSLGEHEQALSHYTEALALFRSLKIPRWEAMTLRNMGLVYDALGDTETALDYYKQSLTLTHAGQDQRYEAYTLNYIGHIYEKSGDAPQALSHYQRALAFNRVAVDRAGESLTLYNIAHLELKRGNLEEARARIEAAITIAESLRTKVASRDLRAAYFASARQYYELYIETLMRLHEQRPKENFAAAAFEMSERARARSLLESLKESHSDIRQGVDPSLLDQERSLQQLLNAKAERQVQLVAGQHREEAVAIGKEIAQIAARYDEVQARIKSTSPHYAALTQPQPLDLREIQKVLDDKTLLLEYSLGDDKSYLWAVTPTEIYSFELPSRALIDDAARRVYALLTSNSSALNESFAERQARKAEAETQLLSEIVALSKLVLGPVAAKLGNQRLLIVADGALQYIPFQLLTTPNIEARDTGPAQSATPTPLLVDHEIVNEPSVSTLALILSETSQRARPPKTVAVLADPVFEKDDPRITLAMDAQEKAVVETSQNSEIKQAFRDVSLNAGGGQIPRLMSSHDEAEAIMSVTPKGTGWEAVGFESSRATATSPELSQYRIVHFATHGILDNEHPELSGIVLSLMDQRGQPQDGFLRLHDIYNLNLPVDLVVLSACNTGLGKDVRGEGLIGLTHGFMYAGAASVVASLWKVDDAATAELMKNFYRSMLQDGLAPAAALRQSQLMMWKQKGWREPSQWAAFVIQGQYTERETFRYHEDEAGHYTGAGALAACLGLVSFFVIRRRRRKILRVE
jgi:CHAT domain-containing protein/predicted negative regulator of RcsB-dependent stress response